MPPLDQASFNTPPKFEVTLLITDEVYRIYYMLHEQALKTVFTRVCGLDSPLETAELFSLTL